jgi:hypothetical protein
LEAGQLFIQSGIEETNPKHFYITDVDKNVWRINYKEVYNNVWNNAD